MKIKVLLNLGSDYPPYKEGEQCDCEDQLAMKLIRRGLAEEIKAALPAKAATIEADEPTPTEKPAPEKKSTKQGA